jgi:hypothetical protein
MLARASANARAAIDRPRLLPLIRILRETGPLDPHDAKALPGRRLHHHPPLEAILHCRPQLYQSRNFGLDIVGLDVYVSSALVVDTLDLHDGFIGRSFQHNVIAAGTGMVAIDRATQRVSPEAGGLFQISGPAINEHGAESGMVHIGFP